MNKNESKQKKRRLIFITVQMIRDVQYVNRSE